MFKKIACVFLVFFCFALQADNPEHEKQEIQFFDEVISLGYECQVAWQLETNGLRKYAYPFDWFRTSFESLMAFIKNKGEHFFEIDKICIIAPYLGHITYFHVQDLIYGIHSFHDFLVTPPLANYEMVKAKYDRRIERFFKVLESNKRVLFVREGLSREQTEELDRLLKDLYPALSFTILAVSDREEFKEDWGSQTIRNFYLKQKPLDWQGDYSRWKEILSNFVIQHDSTPRNPENIW